MTVTSNAHLVIMNEVADLAVTLREVVVQQVDDQLVA
jgi:hypothetical protein